MKFDPKAGGGGRRGLDGTYTVKIVEATDKLSKSGNPMIEIKMTVQGQTAWVWDYFGAKEDGTFFNLDSLKALAELTGLSAQFEAGDLPASALQGKIISAVLMPDKNDQSKTKVKRYVGTPGANSTRQVAPTETW